MVAIKDDKLYALCGGPGQGIYKTWPEAVAHGWRQKEGFGNAVTFPVDRIKDAEEWIQRSPFPEGTVGQFRRSVRESHILCRMLFVMIVGTAFSYILHRLVVSVNRLMLCDHYPNITQPICLHTHRLMILVAEKQLELWNIVLGELLMFIGFAFFWLTSFM